MKKAVLVTASTRGLGLALAQAFSKSGMSVIINGRDIASLSGTMTDCAGVYRFHQDMTESCAVNNLKDFLIKNDLTVSCAIHNLGGRLYGDRHPIDTEIMAQTMRLNLTTAIEINNLLMPMMASGDGGFIFHIGSSAGYTGNSAPCYAMAKGALNTYVRNAARFFAKQNITICGINPGILAHEGSDWDKKRTAEPEKYARKLAEVPLGRFQTPEEIAAVVLSLYLSGSQAINGSIIDITGGM